MENRVFIVSDRTELCEQIQSLLNKAGYQLSIVSPTQEYCASIIRSPHVLTVLDAAMPKECLLDLIHGIRSKRKSPILVLHDNMEPQDRNQLQQKGATAFLQKSELSDSLYEQVRGLVEVYLANDASQWLFQSGLQIIPSARLVLIQGERIRLSSMEFSLLRYFTEHYQQVVSRDELYQQVWKGSPEMWGEDAVRSCIRDLRKKLRPSGRNYIQTVWGEGYIFIEDEALDA